MKGDREESLLIIKKKNQTALDLGNRHFPLSRAALIGVLTWCVGLLDQPSFSKIVRGLTRDFFTDRRDRTAGHRFRFTGPVGPVTG